MVSKAVRLGPKLKELRIILCQKSPESQGVRDFIEQHYVPLKQNNPKFPILVRECGNVEPKLYARYDFGVETSSSLAGLKSDQILGVVQSLETKK